MKRLKDKQYTSIYVTQTISKLVETIKIKENHEQELKNLIDKCIYSEDSVTTLAASSSLILLVDSKVLQTSSLLAQLLSSLSFVKSHIGILTVVCELLKRDIKFKLTANEEYKCEYNLKVPQHPLITILNQHPESWNHILNKIKGFYEDKEIGFYANELMHTFYMYAICNPSLDGNLNFQQKLWNYFINVNDQQSLDVVLHTIMWFPVRKNIVKASWFFMDLTSTERFRKNSEFAEIVILWLTSITYELIKIDEDPQPIINCLRNLFEHRKDDIECSTSIILLMLSNAVSLAPSIYLNDLLCLCKLLLSENSSSEFALKALKASLLHWKAFRCALSKDSVNFATELIQEIDAITSFKTNSNKIYANKLFNLLSCSNELSRSQDPRINFALLKVIPKMAALEENLPLVLNTLKLIGEKLVGVRSFSLTLNYNLWETSNKCYSYLQRLLVDKSVSEESETVKMEFYVTKAYVVKQLCMKSPERYGSELVGYLSEILNSCKNSWGTLATCLALEGIIILCKTGIISIESTCQALEPHFLNETRNLVIKKICEFMSEINSFDPSEYTSELINNTIAKLFAYTTCENEQVVCAAYNALGTFPQEEVMTALNFIIDNEFKGTSLKGKPNCWIYLLENSKTSDLDYVGNFLIKYTSLEIANYRKGTYIIPEGSKEPTNYNYLPERSIVRTLGNYLKRKIQVWKDACKFVFLQCLRVLSQEYSKMLPPFDWCFLQELIHDREAHLYCIVIASRQVQLSGTARRLMENYAEALIDVDNKDEDIITIFRQLKPLCNSIQPMTLRPLVENSLEYALKKYEAEIQNNSKSLLENLVENLREIFIDETLHEANRMAFAQVVVNVTRKISLNSLAFSEILKCVVKLPKRFIDELSSPKLWKSSSSDQLKLSVNIRCAVAEDTNSLSWMDEFINETSFMATEQDFVLSRIANLLKLYRSSEGSSTWLLEYLNHVQSIIANENMMNYNLKFLCDVFIISIMVLSGYDVFLQSIDDLIHLSEDHLLMFPYSVIKLMKIQSWNENVVQVAEWLCHMSIYPETPVRYRKIFFQALVAIRNENALQVSSKWMKYVSYTLPSS
ncbi:hypothetical protein FQR65_LT05851 [Abscondita terminalis]|nr:hypothetical protein FQR65_LT05851 [Abscondita terminalis]